MHELYLWPSNALPLLYSPLSALPLLTPLLSHDPHPFQHLTLSELSHKK